MSLRRDIEALAQAESLLSNPPYRSRFPNGPAVKRHGELLVSVAAHLCVVARRLLGSATAYLPYEGRDDALARAITACAWAENQCKKVRDGV